MSDPKRRKTDYYDSSDSDSLEIDLGEDEVSYKFDYNYKVNNRFEEASSDESLNFVEDDGSVETGQLDLKCFAPLHIRLQVSPSKWPQPIDSDSLRNKLLRDDNIMVEKESEAIDPFSDYYKYNKNRHHVWTNQLVFKKGIEMDTDFNYSLVTPLESIKNYLCNVKTPGNSFYLKPVGKMGYGLFAKHYIPRGLFNF